MTDAVDESSLVDEEDTSTTIEVDADAELLGDQITEWCWVWDEAERLGKADSAFGMEFRHALQRFLAMGPEVRARWLARDEEWQIQFVHHLGVSGPMTPYEEPWVRP